MDVKKSIAVVYIDGLGREHDALVTAVNGTHEGFVTLAYVDVNGPEPDNLKKVFDVAHVSHDSKQEPNPNLPSYDVNAWKFPGELHRALPTDHPGFDHPFKQPELDEQGNIVVMPRPETEAEVAAHQAKPTLKSETAVEEPVAEAPAQLSAPDWAGDTHSFDRVAAFLRSRGYLMKDDAAVHKFMHSLMPPEAKHFREDFAKWASENPAPATPALTPATPAAETAKVNVVNDGLLGGGGPMPSSPSSAPVIETREYTDGSSATGVAPLPDLSPAQQDAAQTSTTEPDVTEMLDQAPPPPAEPEPPVSE